MAKHFFVVCCLGPTTDQSDKPGSIVADTRVRAYPPKEGWNNSVAVVVFGRAALFGQPRR